MVLSLGISIYNAVSKISPEPTTDSPNNSFHRIQSDFNSDISDDSDVETELNSSQQSAYSARSVRSKKSSNFINKSLNASNHSISPSAFSNVSSNNFRTSSNISLNRLPQHDLNRTYTKRSDFSWDTPFNGPAENRFNSQQSCVSGFTSISRPDHERSLRRSFPTDPSQSAFMASPNTNGATSPALDTSFHSRCSSRNSCYDVPDDFQSGITQLSIGSTRKQLQYVRAANPSLFDLAIRNVPPPSNLRQRRHLVQPSKLNFADNRPRLAGHQTSWVAGGYFNQSISPQKRHVFNVEEPVYAHANKITPIISRTSSQSSGFESQNGSLKNGHENHSNESSIGDEIDHESVFSEAQYPPPHQPNRINDWQNYNGSTIARSLSNVCPPVTEQITQPMFSALSEANLGLAQPHLPMSYGSSSSSHRPSSTSRDQYAQCEPPVSFVTQPVHSSNISLFNGQQGAVPKPFSFNKFDKSTSMFKRGSLLRLNNQKACGNNILHNINEDAQARN